MSNYVQGCDVVVEFDDLRRTNANMAQELEDYLSNRRQTGDDGVDQPSEDRPTPPEGLWLQSTC